jgi:hypothetical protein
MAITLSICDTEGKSRMNPTMQAVSVIVDNLQAELNRLKKLIKANTAEDDPIDPKDPRNKSGVNLTPRGVEIVFRYFDTKKTRHAVKELMGISFGAADYRYQQWLKAGGKDRIKQPLQ